MRTRRLAREVWSLVLTALALAGVAPVATAQRIRPPTARWQPEARADYIAARAEAAHIGLGLSVPAGLYVRLGVVAAGGQAWDNGKAMAAGRVDGLVRFAVDPFREFRWAPYAAGGIGAIYDDSEKWRGVLVGVLGVEGPSLGHVVPAFEAGFGGGARFGFALRRAMRGRR